MSGESAINWPEGHRPEESVFHAVNEGQSQAEPEAVFAWLCRADLWSRYYSNAKFIKHLGGPWPKLELGTRFRWWSFGAFVTSEVVEFEPGQRISWDAKEMGGRGFHSWVLEPRSGGTFIRTEETQKGWGITLVRPALRPMMVRMHQRWVDGLAEIAGEGPPPPP